MSGIQVVKRGAQLFWRNKFLWWLGILPGLMVGVFNGLLDVVGAGGENILLMHRDWASLAVFVQERVEINLWLGFFLLVLPAFVISTVFELSTYRAAAQLYLYGEREGIWQLLSRSRKQFWSYLGFVFYLILFGLLVLVPVVIVLMLVAVVLNVINASPIIISWLTAVSFLVQLLTRIYVNTVGKQGIAAMVVEELKAYDSFDRSFSLIRGHFLQYLVVILALGLLSLGIWAATELPFTADLLPALPETIAEIDWLDIMEQFTAYRDLDVETLRPLYLWPVVIIVEGLLSAFVSCVWTVMFLENRGEPEVEGEIEISGGSVPVVN